MLKNTYWNENGKYQLEQEGLKQKLPDIGYTDNPYLNLIIIAHKIYEDIYQTRGEKVATWMELQDEIQTYLLPFNDELQGIDFTNEMSVLLDHLNDAKRLEQWMDSVIEYVQYQDLTHQEYVVYVNDNQLELSDTPKEGFDFVTFGCPETKEDWVFAFLTYHHYEFIE